MLWAAGPLPKYQTLTVRQKVTEVVPKFGQKMSETLIPKAEVTEKDGEISCRYSLTRSTTQLLTHSLTHSLTNSLTH